MTDRPTLSLTSRILRGVALAGLGLAGFAVILGILLWDADLYAVRDRYEHMRLALFGEWQADHWCPPGRVSDTCEVVDSFTAALEQASDFTFFRTMPIAGTGLVVQTGIRFATARDVVDGAPSRQWCYVSIPQGAVSQQIDLATQSADDQPVYAALSSLDESALAGAGLSINALSLIARSHCRFDETRLLGED
tara:strand:- start:10916 stop:11494 length:579 start_codon:yes stop_codon:yes gene_type:complete